MKQLYSNTFNTLIKNLKEVENYLTRVNRNVSKKQKGTGSTNFESFWSKDR